MKFSETNMVDRLILFTRYPEPGVTKTRLIPALGKNGAADLQRRMTEAAAVQAEMVAGSRPVGFDICYDGQDHELVTQWLKTLAPKGKCRPQGEGDLGLRMRRAFEQAFAEGCQRVVLFGCDCPKLTAMIMEQALAALADHDLVIGPALDGGYYLLGMTGPHYFLFENIEWGNDAVLANTIKQAEAFGLRIFLLESLADVDRPEDLCHIHNHPCA